MTTQKTPQPKYSRVSLENTHNKTRQSILLIVIFSTVNLFAKIVDAGFYMLFSATMPYYLPWFGRLYDRMLFLDVLEDVGYFIGIALIGAYLLCWALAKKKKGFLLFALVLFVLDTAFLVYVMYFVQQFADFFLDIVFHIGILVSLLMGVRAEFRLAALPAEEEEKPAAPAEVSAEDAFAPADDFTPADGFAPAEETKRENDTDANG